MTTEEKESKPLITGDTNSRSTGLIRSYSSNNFYRIPVEKLSEAEISNVQKIAASQIELLSSYHQEVLNQAKKSFFWALVSACTGFFFFLVTILFVIYPQDAKRTEFAVVGTIAGAMIEVISAINFYLYGQASAQMGDYQKRLDKTQRFLLANSICENLEGDYKQDARSELVRVIASSDEVASEKSITLQESKSLDKGNKTN